MPLGIGITELLIVGVLALIVFGPKRLPEMGRSLGRGMREFKDSITGNKKDDDELPAGDKAEPVRAEQAESVRAHDAQPVSAEDSEPARAEKSDPTPTGGQSS